jgi:hypothetical protein
MAQLADHRSKGYGCFKVQGWIWIGCVHRRALVVSCLIFDISGGSQGFALPTRLDDL